MHKLELKKAALKLREKDIALKEYKLKIKKRDSSRVTKYIYIYNIFKIYIESIYLILGKL